MTINVLVVDDSALMRKVLTNVLNDCTGVRVTDAARNGEEALKLINKNVPDIITLDVEMPIMNGLETLRAIKEFHSIPVIMLSSKTNEETTFKALELGAEDFIEKPVAISQNWDYFKTELAKRIKVYFHKEQAPDDKIAKTELKITSCLEERKQTLKAIVIGASTGGPKALVSIIQSLSENLTVPVFIVQHMPENFTASFAHRLNTLASVPVEEAKDGQRVLPGKVYLAPGGKHLVLDGNKMRLTKQPKRHSVRPAVDYLFETASTVYGKDIVGIILTGMGKDGAEGCAAIKQQEGYIITQDRQTSTVYGMPRAVVDRGLSDQTASLTEIADILYEMTR
ncbi:MAG: chemotaxis response regulator protein-glutamate methylesterase [Alkalibacterium sp.]|nr:chemotaxis response regulator protein-glutamate methylesterase [Alkalibacterium sp.]